MSTRNQNLDDDDESKWICIYPVYINSKKTMKEGRRLPKSQAVDNPTASEIAEVCRQLGFLVKLEGEKSYSRDFLLKGRVRVQLKVDGNPVNALIPSRKSLMKKVAIQIPKLPQRGSLAAPMEIARPNRGTKTKKVDKRNVV